MSNVIYLHSTRASCLSNDATDLHNLKAIFLYYFIKRNMLYIHNVIGTLILSATVIYSSVLKSLIRYYRKTKTGIIWPVFQLHYPISFLECNSVSMSTGLFFFFRAFNTAKPFNRIPFVMERKHCERLVFDSSAETGSEKIRIF